MIRIDVEGLAQNTALSLLPSDDVAKKLYVKVVDLDMHDELKAR